MSSKKYCSVCNSYTNVRTCQCGITVCSSHVSQHLEYSRCLDCNVNKCNLQMFNHKQCIECYNFQPTSFYKSTKMCDCERKSTKMCNCERK